MPDGADLQHHHAHRVGDDVVQLARDPRTLLGDRDARRGLALALGRARPRPPPRRPAAARSRSAKPASQTIANRTGMKMNSPAGVTGRCRRRRRRREHDDEAGRGLDASRRLPSRKAAARPATNAATEKTTRRPSTNEIAAARSQTAAGAANGKRRRASSGRKSSDDRRHGEPERRPRCANGVLAEGDLERALERGEHDERVERVLAEDSARIAHAPERTRAAGGRVLLR